jgi:hypothetical protein
MNAPLKQPAHGPETATTLLPQVLDAELRTINERRKTAGLGPRSESGLVGLALSGGGIRSAMFNLGFLQALFSSGFLRYVDFLSCVSGGGYIAGYFVAASEAARQVGADPIHDRTDRNHPLATNENGSPTSAARDFTYNGMYLLNPLQFLQYYLSGLISIHCVALSLLVLVCTAVALVWRCFDLQPLRERLVILDWNHDLFVAFYPTVILFVLWFVLYRFAGREKHEQSVWLRKFRFAVFFLLLASPLVGLVILLGNGILGAPAWLGADLTFQERIRLPLAIIVLATLLPLLFWDRLVRSSKQPSGTVQNAIFTVTCYGALFGIPLLLIGFIGQENISGYLTDRGPNLIQQDILAPDAFAEFLDDPAWKGPRIDHERFSQELGKLNRQREALGNDWCWRAWYVLQSVVGQGDVMAYLQQKAYVEQEVLDDDLLTRFNAEALTSKEFTLFLACRLQERTDDPHGWIKKKAAVLVKSGDLQALWDQWQKKKDFDPRWPTPRDWSEVKDDKGATQLQYFNRLMLEALYPQVFRERTEVSTPTVIDRDQTRRLWIFGCAVIVFCVSLCIWVNSTSLHRFYQGRLKEAFIDSVYKSCPGYNPDAPQNTVPAPSNPNLAPLDGASTGAPYLLLGGAINLLGFDHEGERDVYPFLFSPLYCGSWLTGYVPTHSYPSESEPVTLVEAMAVSGAAMTPILSGNFPSLALMALVNLRLGEWLPCPGRNASRDPTFAQLFWQALNSRYREWSHCLVADGGFSEFLGLEELIVRKCKLIVVSDASANQPEDEFSMLAAVVRRLRLEEGVRLVNLDNDEPLDIQRLHRCPDDGGRSKQHFIVGRILYPDYKEKGNENLGILVYAQMTMTGDEEVDLAYYRKTNPTFPNDHITNQFYPEDTIEAYRLLGYHTGQKLAALLPDLSRDKEATPPFPPLSRVLCQLVYQYVERYMDGRSWPERTRLVEQLRGA